MRSALQKDLLRPSDVAEICVMAVVAVLFGSVLATMGPGVSLLRGTRLSRPSSDGDCENECPK